MDIKMIILHLLINWDRKVRELLIVLADRTNGRAYATVLRLSVCRRRLSSVTLCMWLNGAS